MTTDYESFLPFFDALAEGAREIALRYFRTGISVDDKEDKSPVTKADREIEEFLRDKINKQFPSHGIIGEEFGTQNVDAEFVWVLDPIDGTKAFISGMPQFGTIVGLAHQGVPKVGMVDQPFTRERWLGIAHQFCTLNGKPARVLSPRNLDAAYCYSFVPDRDEKHLQAGHYALRAGVRMMRYYGDCYAYGLLASGNIDLVIEAHLNIYDVAGVIPLVQGAGGWTSDWNLREVGLSFKGGFVAASHQKLAEQALALFEA